MRVVRDDGIDALHTGHIAVVDGSGRLVAAHGDPEVEVYPRSAVKPMQAAAALELIDRRPPSDEIAIMAASHAGSRTHQAAVLRLLDRSELTASALRCPPALPTDAGTLRQRPDATRLAHNCSGKHAGFLLATVAAGADPTGYLQADHPVQQAVSSSLRVVTASDLSGPGVDGCGAPAWRMPLVALARGFASLADADGALGAVAAAMRTHPLLVAGHDIVDTELMRAERSVVAKRGAEGVLACAVSAPRGPLGVAIKVSDGAMRAVGPVAVAILERLGMEGPASLRQPAVLGGGVRRGGVTVTPELHRSLADLEP